MDAPETATNLARDGAHREFSRLCRLLLALDVAAESQREERFLAATLKITGGKAILLTAFQLPLSTRNRTSRHAQLGFTNSSTPAVNRYLRDLTPRDPALIALLEKQARTRRHSVCMSRQRLVGDRRWENSEFYKRICRSANVDHPFYSLLTDATHERASLLTLFGSTQSPPLPRHTTTLHMLHAYARCALGLATPPGADAVSQLSPRQRETLDILLCGHSEKQIAAKLSRSVHTVHTHVKAIYRAFDVSTRAELLSKFVAST